mgnify:CR=1 FL=1
MIDYAERGDLVNFKRLFFESDDHELMFWHVHKALKIAVKNRQVDIVKFIIADLHLCIDHEAFKYFLHLYLFGC